jgi:hypothetical protein
MFVLLQLVSLMDNHQKPDHFCLEERFEELKAPSLILLINLSTALDQGRNPLVQFAPVFGRDVSPVPFSALQQ